MQLTQNIYYDLSRAAGHPDHISLQYVDAIMCFVVVCNYLCVKTVRLRCPNEDWTPYNMISQRSCVFLDSNV